MYSIFTSSLGNLVPQRQKIDINRWIALLTWNLNLKQRGNNVPGSLGSATSDTGVERCRSTDIQQMCVHLNILRAR